MPNIGLTGTDPAGDDTDPRAGRCSRRCRSGTCASRRTARRSAGTRKPSTRKSGSSRILAASRMLFSQGLAGPTPIAVEHPRSSGGTGPRWSRLGIDFGTTNSVVALLRRRRRASRTRAPSARRRSTCSAPCCASGPRSARRPHRAAPRGRAGGDRRLSRRSAGQPADHVDEDLSGAAQLHRNAHLRPPLHAGTPDRRGSCAALARAA